MGDITRVTWAQLTSMIYPGRENIVHPVLVIKHQDAPHVAKIVLVRVSLGHLPHNGGVCAGKCVASSQSPILGGSSVISAIDCNKVV